MYLRILNEENNNDWLFNLAISGAIGGTMWYSFYRRQKEIEEKIRKTREFKKNINQYGGSLLFGKMSRNKNGWSKLDIITLFETDYDVMITAQTYENELINSAQEESYKYFKRNIRFISNRIERLICDYVNKNELANYYSRADFNNDIIPTEVIFKQDGSVVILFDVIWDKEHGIAVRVYPDYNIGSQDMFL